jgi:hypothetical protein
MEGAEGTDRTVRIIRAEIISLDNRFTTDTRCDFRDRPGWHRKDFEPLLSE